MKYTDQNQNEIKHEDIFKVSLNEPVFFENSSIYFTRDEETVCFEDMDDDFFAEYERYTNEERFLEIVEGFME